MIVAQKDKFSIGAFRRVEDVFRHGAIGDVALRIYGKDLLLRQAFEEIAEAKDDHLVGDD